MFMRSFGGWGERRPGAMYTSATIPLIQPPKASQKKRDLNSYCILMIPIDQCQNRQRAIVRQRMLSGLLDEADGVLCSMHSKRTTHHRNHPRASL